ncbi:MAG: hypothetical protein EA362_00625 [Saprospirales bacterium]|nr:MAG: hypothetical protein EA362_00625 [Saprospirales bacterium]
MGCSSCGSGKNGEPAGCGNNGHCSTGGCNKLNTFDWLATLDIEDPSGTDLVEVSFKNGAKKEFFINPSHTRTSTGDFVVVDTGSGYDVGKISLSGELVKLQMKKKKIKEDKIYSEVIRRANEFDLDKMSQARAVEQPALVKARAIANTLGLDMKIGDVEYQADMRKATFYYTAEGRVDFRELVRAYAKEFKTKIEMRQIGARQESQRIGGIGSCGRELCCSTWLTDFKSVSTAAARYQNLAINQAKLSGQCGRLKCCLNYELDTYIDALRHFPRKAEKLKTKKGNAFLVKTDIFKKLMFYSYETERGRGVLIALRVDRVHEVLDMNKIGEFPDDLPGELILINGEESEKEISADVTEGFDLPEVKRRNKRNKRRGRGGKNNQQNRHNKGTSQSSATSQSSQNTKENKPSSTNKNRRSRRNNKNRQNNKDQ